MDDFGTGVSSLTALRDLPIDKLTIDRAFITAGSPKDRSTVLAAATISLAHDLALPVVADGVQTDVDSATLTRAGCDRAPVRNRPGRPMSSTGG